MSPTPMNPDDFKLMQHNVHAVFSALYLIDVDHLSSDERKQHQHALAAAYLAYVNAENTKFDELSSSAKGELAELSGQVIRMREGVAGLATPTEKLGVLAKGLDALARLAQTLQIP